MADDHHLRGKAHDEQRKLHDVQKYSSKINYSPRYCDDIWEYRHVTLPQELVKYVPKNVLMSEDEWRSLGVQQSIGWEHYLIHKPEPHMLLFRREKNYQEKYPLGKPNPNPLASSIRPQFPVPTAAAPPQNNPQQ